MKKNLSKILIVFSIFWMSGVQTVWAQLPALVEDSASLISVPFGYTRIGEQNFIGLRIQPEIAIGKIGVGLDIPLLFNIDKNFEFRDQEFKDGISGVLRMIRYFRYGQKKRDRVYFRIGDLTGSYLGNGFLLNNYTNSPSFERRKVGITFDVRPTEKLGFEGTYSDFNGFNLLAFRPYYRPFAESFLPILETLEIGPSIVVDRTQQAIDSAGNLVDALFVKEGVTAFGIDATITLLDTDILELKTFVNAARIQKNQGVADLLEDQAVRDTLFPGNEPLADGYEAGQGFSFGVSANFHVIADVFDLNARIERFLTSDHFQPQFFDAIYEIDKDAKLLQLAATSGVQGTYGTLTGAILNKLRITGGLQLPDAVSETNPALVFARLNANELINKLILTGSYIKGGLSDLSDAFKLDERSLATAQLGYRLNSFLVVGVNVRWTFAKTIEDAEEKFIATRMVMPYFGFYLPFGKKDE